MYSCIYGYIYVSMYLCIYEFLYPCIYASMYVSDLLCTATQVCPFYNPNLCINVTRFFGRKKQYLNNI
jgi:hypothetical protein